MSSEPRTHSHRCHSSQDKKRSSFGIGNNDPIIINP